MSRTEKILISFVGCTFLLLSCVLSTAIAFVMLYLWIPSPPSPMGELTEAQFIEQEVEKILAETLGQKIFAYREEMETTGMGGVFIPTYDLFLCQYEFACIHEVGHWRDKDLNFPSLTAAFRTALETFLDQCERVELSVEDTYYCSLTEFPGLNGNTLGENGWGGYSEAYAEMYVYSVLFNHPLPQAFIEFYR